MPLFLTRYLRLSSILLVTCFFSCRYSRYKALESKAVILTPSSLLPVIPVNGSAQRYTASIDVLNRHFTGLIILKQTDSLSKHLVFVTELGMKMFDFEMKDTAIRAVYVFEPLNKPKFIKVLEQDFKTILLMNVYGKSATGAELRLPGHKDASYKLNEGKYTAFCTYQNGNQLFLQESYRRRRRQTKTAYTFNSVSQAYSHIQFKQYGLVKIYIELNEIPKSDD